MSIYDKTKMMCRTWIEAINNLFNMGKELEETIDGFKGGIIKDVTLTEVDKHYTLTILYDDDTSDTVTWDDSTVGIEDITLNYVDGVYILAIELTDGTRYTFSIPVGDIVTQQELTALNLGTPDDTASSTGSLWARVKYAITTLGDKADKSDTYTKTQVDTALSLKANSSDVYTKSQTDTLLVDKADKSTTYTKTETDNLIVTCLKLKISTTNFNEVMTALKNVNIGDIVVFANLRTLSPNTAVGFCCSAVVSKSSSQIVFSGGAGYANGKDLTLHSWIYNPTTDEITLRYIATNGTTALDTSNTFVPTDVQGTFYLYSTS